MLGLKAMAAVLTVTFETTAKALGCSWMAYIITQSRVRHVTVDNAMGAYIETARFVTHCLVAALPKTHFSPALIARGGVDFTSRTYLQRSSKWLMQANLVLHRWKPHFLAIRRTAAHLQDASMAPGT